MEAQEVLLAHPGWSVGVKMDGRGWESLQEGRRIGRHSQRVERVWESLPVSRESPEGPERSGVVHGGLREDGNPSQRA